jgi:hypothetical protein
MRRWTWLAKNALLDAIKAAAVGALLIATAVTLAYSINALVRMAGSEHHVNGTVDFILIFITALVASFVFGLIPAVVAASILSYMLTRSEYLRGHGTLRVSVAAATGALCTGLLVYGAMVSDGRFSGPLPPHIVALGTGVAGCVAGAVVGRREPRESVDRVA